MNSMNSQQQNIMGGPTLGQSSSSRLMGDDLQYMPVNQSISLSLSGTIGMGNNTVMAFQRNSIMPSVSSYTDSSLTHNLTTEDILAPSLQSIAFIAPDSMMSHTGNMQGDISLNPIGEMNPAMEMYTPQLELQASNLNEYQHSELDNKVHIRPPKRTMSAYSFYSRSVFKDVRDSMGDQARQCDIFKKIASQWKEMSPEEKKPFEDQAKIDHKRYKEEMKRFNKNRRDVEKSVNRFGGQPFKYSKSLYHAFQSKNYMRVGQILLTANGNNKKETVDIINRVVNLLQTSGTTLLSDQQLAQSQLNAISANFSSSPDKKTYRCPVAGCNKYQYMKNESCYREFSWKSNLNNHMQIHDPNRSKSFICQYCKKGFYDAQHLKQHQWIHNRNPEGIRCPHPGCDRKYSSQSGLQLHIQTHHKNEKKFVCEYEGCNKAFARHNDLTMHCMRIHKSERPYKCNVEGCEKSFVSPSELKRHLNTHNSFPINDLNVDSVHDLHPESPQMEL